jgi:hypothetical protein
LCAFHCRVAEKCNVEDSKARRTVFLERPRPVYATEHSRWFSGGCTLKSKDESPVDFTTARSTIGEAGDGAGQQQRETTMRVMVIVKATKDSEAEVQPGDEQMLKEMGAFNEELVKAGIMLAGEGLRPSSQGKRVRFSGPRRTVVDGPFTETKELVAGFWLWKVKSMDEAVEWVKRCPNPMPGDSEIEIRPVYETEDFAAIDPTGDLRKQENELRKKIEAQQR